MVSPILQGKFLIQTMSSTPEVANNSAINNLVQASLESERYKLEWIPCSQITHIEPTRIDNVYYATYKETRCYPYRVEETMILLLLLGSSEECTPTLVSEFARIYSLPTHNYNNDGVNQFKRYK